MPTALVKWSGAVTATAAVILTDFQLPLWGQLVLLVAVVLMLRRVLS